MSDDVKRLREVLEIYGADPARWPATERGRLEGLTARREDARRLLAEARALEAVMAHAPAGQTQIRARNQIMAAIAPRAEAEPTATPRSWAGWLDRLLDQGRALQPAWPSAAVMTAALALGIYLGASGLTRPVLDQAVMLAAIDGGAVEAEQLFGGAETEFQNDGGQ